MLTYVPEGTGVPTRVLRTIPMEQLKKIDNSTREVDSLFSAKGVPEVLKRVEVEGEGLVGLERSCFALDWNALKQNLAKDLIHASSAEAKSAACNETWAALQFLKDQKRLRLRANSATQDGFAVSTHSFDPQPMHDNIRSSVRLNIRNESNNVPYIVDNMHLELHDQNGRHRDTVNYTGGSIIPPGETAHVNIVLLSEVPSAKDTLLYLTGKVLMKVHGEEGEVPEETPKAKTGRKLRKKKTSPPAEGDGGEGAGKGGLYLRVPTTVVARSL